tara:strand:- start:325 stop:1935 length:1611 start_codon:yes stop_codon:yes gene_type:complete
MAASLPFKFDFKNPDYTEVFAYRADMLNRIRKSPDQLPAILAHYKNNPAQMIIDWGCTADPRNAERNLPAVIPFILFDRQIEWVDWCMDKWKGQESAPTVKSRDMGLSWLTIALASVMSITHDDLVIGFGSRKEEYVDKIGSPKSLFHKGRMFVDLLPPEFRGGFNSVKTAPHMRLLFPGTGSAIVGEAGDGIGRGDRASIYFVDEAAFLERPQLVEASLSQTTNCRIDVSTPNGLANPFAEKVMGGRFDTFRFHWRDDPRKDDAWYAKQKATLDPVTVAQEIDIDFAASVDGVLIPSAWVQAAIGAAAKLKIDPSGEKVTALDVADMGKDTNAQAYRNGLEIMDIREWHGSTVEDIYGTTQKAIEHCDEWGCYKLGYDSDGIGAGVRGDARVINEIRKDQGLEEADAISFHGSGEVQDKDKEVFKGRTNGSFFENYKAQCWWRLRDRFKLTYEALENNKPYTEADIISISPDCSHLARLTAELSRPTYKKSGRGRIIVNKAPDGAASPNLADSVMMVFGLKQKRKIKPMSISFVN